MSTPGLPKLWHILLLGGAACAAASALRLLAWYDGTRGRYGLLLLANLLRLGVVFFAFSLLLWSVGLHTRQRPAPLDRFNLLGVSLAVVLVLVCAGTPALWPAPLAVLAALLAVQSVRRRDLLAPGWRPVFLRAALALALFVLAWYQAAATTNSALCGLGERIEETAGSGRLREWARQEIDGTPRGQRKTLRWDEVPDDVFDMMGGLPGWPVVWVEHTDEPSVSLANGSGYGYGVRIYPPGEGEEKQGPGMPWRPGVFLYTVSK